MKKYVAIAALLLVTAGCTANNDNNGMNGTNGANGTNGTTHQQAAKNPVRMNYSARSLKQATTVTQASSVSTPGANRYSVSMQQLPGNLMGNLPDWLVDYFPVRTPSGQVPSVGRTPAGQNPATPNPGAGQNQNPAPKQPANASAFEEQVLQLVNQHRSSAGLSPLSMDGNLSNVALAKAKDMVENNYFDHNSPTYGSPFDMMKQFGITYRSAGENIAKGQSSPEQVMNDWMNSPGHRANILNSSFTKLGVGFYNNAWVQHFTG
ncbi:CAP domain-containing protein [Paenibacillus arenilitoris]|uniref:SCP-like extracellular n=1 Tax=Paenibacillus arenilitoris TaxID=2772299 RepID=A0A927H751_9BACL|nr:CAP domain-containing protein [Paenibacillus arenilitoris]MBD2869239.1 SCP-like extracellular [Paenibacillus arenilitoris]